MRRCYKSPSTMTCILSPYLGRSSTRWYNNTVGRRLVVSFCGQSASCLRPYYPAAWFLPAMPIMDTAEPLLRGPMSCQSAQIGACCIRTLQLRTMADHESHHWLVPANKIWWWSDEASWSWWWHNQLAEKHGIYSIHQMKFGVCEAELCEWFDYWWL